MLLEFLNVIYCFIIIHIIVQTCTYDSDIWRYCKIFENIQNLESDWMTTSNPCNWWGISCVTNVINMMGKDLKGELNFTIPWPRNLEEIYLNNNLFNNSLTDVDFGVFPNTTKLLKLKGNLFSGARKIVLLFKSM